MMKAHLATVLMLLSSSSAMASPDGDLLAKSGLLGAWAADCRQAPSQQNPYQVFAESQGAYPTRTLKMASSIDRTSEIRNVRLLGADKVRFVLKGSKDFDDRYVTVIVVGKRHRSIDVTDLAGKTKYVTNGKFDGSPNDTPWFQKCAG